MAQMPREMHDISWAHRGGRRLEYSEGLASYQIAPATMLHRWSMLKMTAAEVTVECEGFMQPSGTA